MKLLWYFFAFKHTLALAMLLKMWEINIRFHVLKVSKATTDSLKLKLYYMLTKLIDHFDSLKNIRICLKDLVREKFIIPKIPQIRSRFKYPCAIWHFYRFSSFCCLKASSSAFVNVQCSLNVVSIGWQEPPKVIEFSLLPEAGQSPASQEVSQLCLAESWKLRRKGFLSFSEQHVQCESFSQCPAWISQRVATRLHHVITLFISIRKSFVPSHGYLPIN